MQSKLRVSRFDPETMGEGQRRWDEFELEVHPSATVLDALIQIREEVDGDSSFTLCLPSFDLRIVRYAREWRRQTRVQNANC